MVSLCMSWMVWVDVREVRYYKKPGSKDRKGEVAVTAATIRARDDDKTRKNLVEVFVRSTASSKARVFTMCMESPEDRTAWIAALELVAGATKAEDIQAQWQTQFLHGNLLPGDGVAAASSPLSRNDSSKVVVIPRSEHSSASSSSSPAHRGAARPSIVSSSTPYVPPTLPVVTDAALAAAVQSADFSPEHGASVVAALRQLAPTFPALTALAAVLKSVFRAEQVLLACHVIVVTSVALPCSVLTRAVVPPLRR